jgi:hypothetical protein
MVPDVVLGHFVPSAPEPLHHRDVGSPDQKSPSFT